MTAVRRSRWLPWVVGIIGVPMLVYGVSFLCMGGTGIRSLTFVQQGTSVRPLCFAHRGVVGVNPENSAGALWDAVHAGYTAAEVDIRRTADGRLVLLHDADTRRMLGIDGQVADMTLEALGVHPLLHQGMASGSHVLTVEELLDTFGRDLALYFDMKVPTLEVADAMAEAIRSRGMQASCILASANVPFLAYVRWAHPDLITALEGFDQGKEWTFHLFPERLKPDFYAGFISNAGPRQMDWMRARRLDGRRIVYGVDGSNLELVDRYGIPMAILDHDSTSALLAEWLESNAR